MNKILLIMLIPFFILGCSQKEEPKEASSEGVVKVKTVDELIKAKKEGKATSELDLCMSKANEYMTWRESTKEECKSKKLADEGYTDGKDCIGTGMQGICGDVKRYNAEVEAINSCGDELKAMPRPEGIEELSIFDCMSLTKD